MKKALFLREMARPLMSGADKFFFGFFVVDLFLACVLDATGLQLSRWPPQPVKAALSVYCDMVDPLFCAAPLWLRTLLAVEAVLYPPYIIATLVALREGVGGSSDGYEVATVAWATMNAYSVLPIMAEALAGELDVRTPAPMLYIAAYAPFIFLPLAYARHVYAARRSVRVPTKQS